MRKESRLASQAIYLFLLPLFFVLHGYLENREAMNGWEALTLFGEYALAAGVLFGLGFLLIGNIRKAALFAFTLLFFHLFFGVLHDGVKAISPGSFLSKYLFILPFLFLFFTGLFIYLRKTKNAFSKLAAYLNLLFVLLIAIDAPRLFFNPPGKTTVATLTGTSVCDTCSKPDIYLIIADEYADSASLQQIFSFNNSDFEAALRRRGFHFVQNSKSNYNFTPFAMASLFQMNYLKGIEGRNQSLSDRNKCYNWINNAGVLNFLQQQGYEIKNNSIFGLAGIPTPAPENYILIGKEMISAHTFTSRINKDLRYHLATTFKLESEINRISYFMNHCNQLLLSRLMDDAFTASQKPRFIYTHLTMPHYPYYYRSNGQPNPVALLQEGEQVRKKEYIEYLRWTNGVLLETVDRILTQSKKPPIILLMGDHGFREFTDGFEKNAPYYYMNLNAVLLPSGDYSKFYNGISSVNQFRALLNTAFEQKLPYLKDSTILLYE
ncbi:MAG TPA: hypothetical protein VMR70_16610 [Flavisolibacter sp.]|nr:hypothetical protein [Flavisolibacter sp.]